MEGETLEDLIWAIAPQSTPFATGRRSVFMHHRWDRPFRFPNQNKRALLSSYTLRTLSDRNTAL